jgi:hypothetical protein
MDCITHGKIYASFLYESKADRLYNIIQQIQSFQINDVIQILTSSTCFEHHVFIINKTILYIYAVLYGVFFIHTYM